MRYSEISGLLLLPFSSLTFAQPQVQTLNSAWKFCSEVPESGINVELAENSGAPILSAIKLEML